MVLGKKESAAGLQDRSRPIEWRNLRRAAAAFKPYRARLALVLGCILITTLLGVANPLLARAIFDDAIRHRNFSRLLLYSSLMFASPVLSSLIGLGQSTMNTRIAQGVIQDFRNRLYTHLQRMPLSFFTGTRGGEIQSRFANDIGGLQNFITNTAVNALSSLTEVLTIVAAMFYISPMLMLLSLGLMPPVLLNNYWVARRRRALGRERQSTMAMLSALMYETLSLGGVLLTRTFGRQKEACQKFDLQNQALVAIEVRQQLLGRLGFFGLGVLFSAIPAAIFFLAGWQLIREVPLFGVSMTAGTLIAFVGMQTRLFGQAAQLLSQPASIQSSLVLLERVFEYLDLPVEMTDKPGALQFNPAKIRGEVSFRNVWFTYRRSPELPDAARKTELSFETEQPAAKPTLKNISFDIVPGQVVAVVGPSGAGKTTISYLLARLYDVDAGVVAIDGHNVKDVTLVSLAACIGVVTQETFLLHASIRENLLYARPDAHESEMIEAAKAAAIHERILSLDHGYDTVVGERGFKLSGGEKQRVAIARVMLRNPRILLLDEATSALDARSERLVQNALDALMKGRTTLVIAHRLSTIMAANIILVLEAGEIVDRGTHAELSARRGLYSRLYEEQFAHLGTPPEPASNFPRPHELSANADIRDTVGT